MATIRNNLNSFSLLELAQAHCTLRLVVRGSVVSSVRQQRQGQHNCGVHYVIGRRLFRVAEEVGVIGGGGGGGLVGV